MAYELIVDGKSLRSFATGEEATAYARQIAHERPNAVTEIVDAETRAPYAPGATKADRERLAGEIGY